MKRPIVQVVRAMSIDASIIDSMLIRQLEYLAALDANDTSAAPPPRPRLEPTLSAGIRSLERESACRWCVAAAGSRR